MKISKRAIMWAAFIPFMLVQAYLTLGPGGIVESYGFLNAFPVYFELSFGDPLLSAGVVDFMVVIIIALLWMLHELREIKPSPAKLTIWIISYLVFPGLGFFLFFLWLYPSHRFMR